MAANKSSLSDLQKIQNIACRLIPRKNKRASVTMHHKLKLFKLDDRRTFHLSLTCHKAIYEENHSLAKFFNKQRNLSDRVTRTLNSMNMAVPGLKSSKSRHSFAYRGTVHWNSLTNEFKNISKFNSFKNRLLKNMCVLWENHPT